ncbi:quinone-dependent dihydroorotate dehydrogenase [Parasulfitobacter algicola]|uniref:Dihydroorotate dehydrogenase (quinone) n=1 Tax=Parasulfitobacter algicola TaxID=2614809 RepID=A0ABX2IM64_9RHOB|nr:quinone-dependent dihydroorotate dehydrogenase [Sulfitobacter algicola]NSX53969.1 quinone-dependent dihydroorotate dehydrogenase [Sulfitobacter algicola]
MTPLERMGLGVLRRMDPEYAHGLSIKALKMGLAPTSGVVTSDRLRTTVAGLTLPNPVGLAAGFDKNAEALAPLARAGFGFIEVGAVTPRPQQGNPKPRLFRLTEDHAAINRFGFNNEGMDVVAERLAERPKDAVIGLNLGANKDSHDRAADFATVLAHCGPYVDFATVNVSSPNTEKLRDLQGKDALGALLAGVIDARAGMARNIPIFLKIAPDLSDAEIGEVSDVAGLSGIDGIIATNTTLDREGLTSALQDQAGGMSGKPLFKRSTRVLAQLARQTDLPLIGVGGIFSAQDAYDKIKAGASAVQFYTAMVYQGVSMAAHLPAELDQLLARDGYDNIEDAVGAERHRWA